MQKTGLRRNNQLQLSADKFYTKTDVVDICLEHIKSVLCIEEDDLLIEPSAGNGAFSIKMRSMFKNVIALDIHPEDEHIIMQDFLTIDTNNYITEYDKIHVIGNPPFGRQSCDAKKFIKKACSFAKTISFILPKSFKKESMQRAFDERFHLVKQIDLDENSFLVNNMSYSVPCVFQIWEKGSSARNIPEKISPIGFTFVNKGSGSHCAFRRVGFNAGQFSFNDIESKCDTTHYFIKFLSDELYSKFVQKYVAIQFSGDNTVGPKSISKRELTLKINELFVNRG